MKNNLRGQIEEILDGSGRSTCACLCHDATISKLEKMYNIAKSIPQPTDFYLETGWRIDFKFPFIHKYVRRYFYPEPKPNPSTLRPSSGQVIKMKSKLDKSNQEAENK